MNHQHFFRHIPNQNEPSLYSDIFALTFNDQGTISDIYGPVDERPGLGWPTEVTSENLISEDWFQRDFWMRATEEELQEDLAWARTQAWTILQPPHNPLCPDPDRCKKFNNEGE